jgi:hypothetical protein
MITNTTKIKLYSLITVAEEGYSYIGQVLSLPVPATPEFPHGSLMVRRVPGDPTTLEEVSMEKLTLLDNRTFARGFVQYAEIRGSFSFPVDMLRYDRCAPVNFRLVSRHGTGSVKAESLYSSDAPLLIGRVVERKGEAWTDARWSSFCWGIKPLPDATRTVKSSLEGR